MNGVVNDTTMQGNRDFGIFYHAPVARLAPQWAMLTKQAHRPTYIRQWRKYRGYSLDKLAEMVPMDKSNLSKVERGILQYNQEMLERIAEALMTDPASLLMRDPSNPEAIWSLWERALPGERRQIEAMVDSLIKVRKLG
jgi:transcriptional regulator with XRE-family HTH domain